MSKLKLYYSRKGYLMYNILQFMVLVSSLNLPHFLNYIYLQILDQNYDQTN